MLDNETTTAASAALEAASNMAREIVKALTRLVPSIIKAVKAICDCVLLAAGNVNPKYWHYYTHAKKWRVRKKYRDKILREIRENFEKGVYNAT